jgi:hypothetical protein
VHTEHELDDVIGDIVTKFDESRRKGFNLTVNASNPGYNGPSNVRNLFFGLDSGTAAEWTDCGRPNEKTHISDALTVFKGDLYAGTTDGPDEADWAHVYRYKGGQQWEDLGRLGSGRTRGVYAIIVHDGDLYACTSASHGEQPPGMDFGHVYRYLGGRKWEDIGCPGDFLRIHGIASYRGKLYITVFNIGGPGGHVYSYEGDSKWHDCGKFDGNPHALTVHDGRLYTAYPHGEVFAYDGKTWTELGNPFGSTQVCNQIHSLGVHNGELHIGSWPMGKVAVWRDEKWVDLGRLGDATELVSLSVYNGSFYAGSIPRAEVFRFDGPGQWTSMRRLFDPPAFEPIPVGQGGKGVEDWTRSSGMAVYQGKLFVSTATCYRTMMAEPRPDEIRGKVFSMATGAGVSLDDDMGPGWTHVAAVRAGGKLRLHIDGKIVAAAETDVRQLDVSSAAPLRIGFGPQSHFRGKIREVRLYNRALGDDEIRDIGEASKLPSEKTSVSSIPQ